MALCPRVAVSLVATSVLAACSGSMATQRLSEDAMSNTQDEIKGVVFYHPALFAETSIKTIYVREGKYVGRSTDNPPACVEVVAERAVTLPDLKKPYSIRYHAGIFETSTFGVALKDGMLAGVNAAPHAVAATPQLSFPTSPVTGTLAPLGIPAGSTTAPLAPPAFGLHHVQLQNERPACNEGPVIVGYRRLEIP